MITRGRTTVYEEPLYWSAKIILSGIEFNTSISKRDYPNIKSLEQAVFFISRRLSVTAKELQEAASELAL